MCASVAGVREKRREQGRDDVKLTFIDVKKAEWVEVRDDVKKFGKDVELER